MKVWISEENSYPNNPFVSQNFDDFSRCVLIRVHFLTAIVNDSMNILADRYDIANAQVEGGGHPFRIA